MRVLSEAIGSRSGEMVLLSFTIAIVFMAAVVTLREMLVWALTSEDPHERMYSKYRHRYKELK